MKHLLAALLLMLPGCATVEHAARPRTIRESQIVEALPLPKHPSDAPLADFPGDEAAVFPISKDEPSPIDGIVVSERRAARDSEYRSRYAELRSVMEADRKVWALHRELYEQQLDAAHSEIQSLEPGWAEKNALQLGVVAGVVIGASVTIGIAAAIVGVSK